MYKMFFVALSLLVTSMSSQATLISHNGYQRDSASNIVKGGGLEWLKWDLTKGSSINSAIAKYSKDGWVLASNVQMAALLNAFQFGKSDWTSQENIYQSVAGKWDASESTVYNNFVELFGFTTFNTCAQGEVLSCHAAEDPRKNAYAIFGSDANKDGMVNIAMVVDDATLYGMFGNSYLEPSVMITADIAPYFYSSSNHGVALVRTPQPSVSPVNTSATLSLFVFGLIGLGCWRRKASGG